MISLFEDLYDIPFYFRCFKEFLLSLKDLVLILINLFFANLLCLAIFLLASPIDFIPEFFFGAFGLIDDVIYLMIIVYAVVKIKIYS